MSIFLTALAKGQVDGNLLVWLSKASPLLAQCECGVDLLTLKVALVASHGAGLSIEKAKVVNAVLNRKGGTLLDIALSPMTNQNSG